MSIWAIRWKRIRVKLRRGDCLQVSWDDDRGEERRREERRIEERRIEERRGEEKSKE